MWIDALYPLALLFVVANNQCLQLVESASIRLIKPCYNIGDAITVRFINAKGEGIFVGLYPDADITNRQQLPALDSPSLKNWVLTCGRHNNCEDWPAQGLVALGTDGLEEDDYIIAISGNRSGLVPQATTGSFHIGNCPTVDHPIAPETPTIQPFVPIPAPTHLAPTLAPIQTESTTQPVPTEETVLVVSDSIISVIDDARLNIENLIRNDGDLTGKFLRLAFHDCIGGCNGCVDMANPDNAGLDKPISILQPIANAFGERGLTRTDIWMLAGLVAIETAVPPDDRDILFDLKWIGRKTCENMIDCGVDFSGNPTTCTPMRGPHVSQAHATFGTRSIQTFFETEFNFSPQQVTALMGAHSVGGMSRQNSGFSGRWDLSSTTFDGGYWIELIGQPPEYFLQDVINDDLPGIPNRRQWQGIVSVDSQVTMLHTDIALVRNLEDMQDGTTNCDFNGPRACSQDTPFMPHARRYNQDHRSWLFDFRDVFNILIDHGNEKVGECPFGRICTFGFELPDSISAENIGRLPVVSPSFFLENEFPENEGEPMIIIDKACYNSGERIVVTFTRISGRNIWIGILPSDQVQNFRDLPVGPDSGNDILKEWTFSCGHRSCHTWLSNGGFQFPTDRLDQDQYTIVVSGDDGSLEGQAATSFSFGQC